MHSALADLCTQCTLHLLHSALNALCTCCSPLSIRSQINTIDSITSAFLHFLGCMAPQIGYIAFTKPDQTMNNYPAPQALYESRTHWHHWSHSMTACKTAKRRNLPSVRRAMAKQAQHEVELATLYEEKALKITLQGILSK